MSKQHSTPRPVKRSSIRINRFLAAAGVCSRRKADDLIVAGRVSVNGTQITTVGKTIDPQRDLVKVDGVPAVIAEHKLYALHKPAGVVSTLSDELGRTNISSLIRGLPRVFPVGRLDKSSEGLILLTNDGELALRLTHPRYRHQKVYHVWTHRSSEPIPHVLERLRRSRVLDGRHRRFDEVAYLESQNGMRVFSVTLHEGIKHQVRRMFDRAGLTVGRLKRMQHGPIVLGDLAPGVWRELSIEERQLLTDVKTEKRVESN